jgi:hypothetical protein
VPVFQRRFVNRQRRHRYTRVVEQNID